MHMDVVPILILPPSFVRLDEPLVNVMLTRSCGRVGGIIGETSFKFFIQFLIYGMLYCVFVLAAMAVFVAEDLKQVR